MTVEPLPRSETAPGVRPRSPVQLALRPFAYLLLAVFWTAMGLLFFALGPGFLLYALVDGGLTLGEQWRSLVSQPSEMAAFVLAVPLLSLLWGSAVLWMLPCASWPLAGLAWVHLARSLRPRFAGDALSYTTWGARGETFGITATNVALSLQPVHRSRATDLLMRFYRMGWTPRWSEIGSAIPAGLGWLMYVVVVAADAPPVLRVALAVVGAGLVALTVVRLRRQWRVRYDPSFAPPGAGRRGRPERRVADLSAVERRARLEELRRARERRVGER
ncbi:hypothetical protein [Puerhibacterium sp. TATVAM-FAB25]|uniref:hypothetical protein n=1 Tax=Puerhibacterium sp. TATVAM-FAB25 TaxID=3093699 RepID=UPI00397B1A72